MKKTSKFLRIPVAWDVWGLDKARRMVAEEEKKMDLPSSGVEMIDRGVDSYDDCFVREYKYYEKNTKKS